MNDITKSIKLLNNDVSPVFMVMSIVLGIILIMAGLRLNSKNKEKSTAGWICIGIGITSIISNVIQLVMKSE